MARFACNRSSAGPAVWPGLWLTGASYDGLGIPACITDAERVAREVASALG